MERKKYLLFVAGFLIVYVIGTLINYFMAGIFLTHVHYSTPVEANFRRKIEFGNYNTRWGMIIATIALGIKLSKNWYQQQKENLEILKRKTKSEMQLQKARIHPELLFRSLNSIKVSIQSESSQAGSLILSFSDLLSYSLYENDKRLVLLEKEISALQHLIFLEQVNKENPIEIQMQTNGEINKQHIAPMLIVKLLEESIDLLRNQPDYYQVHLQISVESSNFNLNISFIDLDKETETDINWSSLLVNSKTRLNEYYSDDHFQIKLDKIKNKAIIKLNLRLTENHEEINEMPTINLISAYDAK